MDIFTYNVNFQNPVSNIVITIDRSTGKMTICDRSLNPLSVADNGNPPSRVG